MTDYEISVWVELKVAMEHKATDEDAYEEAFLATDRLFDGYSRIKLIDTTDIKIDRAKFFDYVAIKEDVRVFVSNHNHEKAMAEAVEVIKDISLPVGVIINAVEAYDYDYDYRYDGLAL